MCRSREGHRLQPWRRIVWALLGSLGGLVVLSSAAAGQANGDRRYRVQVAAHADASAAALELEAVSDAVGDRWSIHVMHGAGYYRVQVGDFVSIGPARRAATQMRAAGYTDAWIALHGQGRTPGDEVPLADLVVAREQAAEQARRAQELAHEPVQQPSREPVRARVAETEVAQAPEADSERAPAAATAVTPATAPIVTPATAPVLQGFHDGGNCKMTYGWVWDSSRPNDPIDVDIYDSGRLVATVTAANYREGLEDAGKGNGAHSFMYSFPDGGEPGERRLVEVRVAGTDVPLQQTPQWLDCPLPGDGPPAASPLDGEGRKQVRAARVRAGDIEVDGRLDDMVWRRAVFVQDFEQKGPDRGYPPRERTGVAFAFGEDALYVAARMEKKSPETLYAPVGRRDEPGIADRILVSLDTYLDRRTAYTFGVTAGGVRVDHHHPEDREGRTEGSYDPVWEAYTAPDSSGWTAEMRIPFSQLRFNEGDASTWGVNVRRWDPGGYLNAYWVVVPIHETGWASRFGTLVGIPTVQASRRFEVTPYGVATATFLDDEIAAPGEGRDTDTRFGVDLKAGLSSNLTLDATINPDFGQVEADPAEVNLTAFETRFEERRPFFTEGSQLLRGSGPDYFYSRRIGAVPQPNGLGNVVDAPKNGTIAGAAKLTGRLPSGLSVGGLVAVTTPEDVLTVDDLTGEVVPVALAPTTAFGVTRIQKEFGAHGSSAGFVLTGVERDLGTDTGLERRMSRRAYSGGGDWNLRFSEGTYELSGHAGFSTVQGDTSAIRLIQRSSARYFQRPDATHVQVDPTRTSLSGYTGGLRLAKLGGEHWLWDVGFNAESPGFEIKDSGILDSADDLELTGGLRYREAGRSGPFRHYTLGLALGAGWNFEGVRQFTSPSLFASGTWDNFWRTWLRVGFQTRALSDDLTRGGPLMGTASAVDATVGLSSSAAAVNQWSLSARSFFDEFGGWSFSVDGWVAVRPSSNLELALSPGYLRASDSRQFFGEMLGSSDATFGRRYVFSRLDRSEIYAQLSASLGLAPDLTVELHAEPFASSGSFLDFGELAEAGGRELRLYGTDGTTVGPTEDGSLIVTDGDETFTLWNSDFNVRSFRTNAVVRWEWRRGSTLFLIWQQNRWYWDEQGDLVSPGSLFRAVGDVGENILVAKLSYWLSLD